MGLFRRKPKAVANIVAGGNGFGEPVHIVHEKRALTIGEGANVFAFETLLLPTYSPIGWGVQPQRQLKVTQGGVQFSRQGITLQALGDPGNISGAFVQQPLTDTSNSDSAIAVPLAPDNRIPTGAQS